MENIEAVREQPTPLNPETLKAFLLSSAIRTGGHGLPWKPENEHIAIETWLAILANHQISTATSFAKLLNAAHSSRRGQDLGRPVTLDHLVYVQQRRAAGLAWSIREEKWVERGGWNGR